MSKLDHEKPLIEGLMYKPTIKQTQRKMSLITSGTSDPLSTKGNQAFLQGMMQKKGFLHDAKAVFCSWDCVKKDVNVNAPPHLKWSKNTLLDISIRLEAEG
jgi:hypothetical protein